MEKIKLIGTAAITFIACAGIHFFLNWISDIDHRKEMLEQKTQLEQLCAQKQKTQQEVSNAYQQKITALNQRVATLVRVRPQCIMPNSGKPTSGHNAAAPDKRLPVGNGISTEWLADFAGRCEAVGLQLDATQDFIRRACSPQ